jgi:hypothetical protein
MEGLTITPDGTTLVGVMQSALQQPDLGGTSPKNIVPDRIVTYNLRTRATHEYLFLLDNPKTTGVAVSEITALSDTSFLVDERDGSFPGPGVYKKLWKISISGATDVGPAARLPGASYDATGGGLLVGGKSIEALTAGQDPPPRRPPSRPPGSRRSPRASTSISTRCCCPSTPGGSSTLTTRSRASPLWTAAGRS